jgi:hypothetical protein
MDPALYRAVLSNDIHAFISLVLQNEAILTKEPVLPLTQCFTLLRSLDLLTW